jgi:hypothetical protein
MKSSSNKPKVIQDFEKLSKEIQEQIKLYYPEGFSENLIKFTNKNGEFVRALPFETEEKVYLVRMSVKKAEQIINDDMDYDDDGILKENVREKFEDKYSDIDFASLNEDNATYDDSEDEEDD